MQLAHIVEICQWGRHSIFGALQSCVNKEAVARRCSAIRVFLKISPHACNFFKKTPTQVFSCEFCEIFKNTFSTEHLRWLLRWINFSGRPRTNTSTQYWKNGLIHRAEFHKTTRKSWQKAKLRKVAPSGLRQFLATKSPLKKMKNVFLFRLESSFRCWDISNFVLSFWSCRKTAWQGS